MACKTQHRLIKGMGKEEKRPKRRSQGANSVLQLSMWVDQLATTNLLNPHESSNYIPTIFSRFILLDHLFHCIDKTTIFISLCQHTVQLRQNNNECVILWMIIFCSPTIVLTCKLWFVLLLVLQFTAGRKMDPDNKLFNKRMFVGVSWTNDRANYTLLSLIMHAPPPLDPPILLYFSHDDQISLNIVTLTSNL